MDTRPRRQAPLPRLLLAGAVLVASCGLSHAADLDDAAGAAATGPVDRMQKPGAPKVIVPRSSVEKPGDVGKKAHTNYEILNTHGPIKFPHPGRVPLPAPVR
jgi:hypothetical protein